MAINRICEGFHCTPRLAIAEVDLDPELTALRILDLRTYLACKRDLDTAKNIVHDLKHWDGTPTMTLVETLTYELRQERLAANREREE